MSANATDAAAAAAAAEAAVKAVLSVDLGASFGPFILGFAADAVMWGVSLHLFADWWTWSRPTERQFICWLVYYTMLVSTTITFFSTAYAMHVFAYNFGLFSPMLEISWNSWYFVFDGVSRTPVMIFFCERAVRMAGNSKILIVILTLLVATALGGSLASKALDSSSFASSSTGKAIIYLYLSCEVVADLIVTITILVCLVRSRTGWSSTNSMINRLITIVVETQAPPTIIAIIYLSMQATTQETTTPRMVFFICMFKISCLSLLSVLNLRHRLQVSLDTRSQPKAQTFPALSRTRDQGQTEINITTETYTESHRMDDLYKSSWNDGTKKQISDGVDLDDHEAGTIAVDYASSRTRLTNPA